MILTANLCVIMIRLDVILGPLGLEFSGCIISLPRLRIWLEGHTVTMVKVIDINGSNINALVFNNLHLLLFCMR